MVVVTYPLIQNLSSHDVIICDDDDDVVEMHMHMHHIIISILTALVTIYINNINEPYII